MFHLKTTLALLAAAATATSALTIFPRTSRSDIDTYLSTHNTVRKAHGAVDLVWNDALATAAQSWANGCVFEHSGGSLGPYGENLAAGTGNYGITNAVNDWTNEACERNFPQLLQNLS